MSDNSAPAPPNYVGAAQAQGQANLEAALASGFLNNPNVINPYGTQSISYIYDYGPRLDSNGVPIPGTKQIKSAIPTITQKLSPEQQRIYNLTTQGKESLAKTGANVSNQINNILSKGISFKGLPNAPISSGQRRNDVVNAMMSRVNTDTANQRQQTNSDLIAAGIRPGTAAYSTAMNEIDRQYNDARNNALLAGGQEATRDFGMDTQARQQALSEMLTQRQAPINELSALQSQSQINNPFASGLGYQGGQQVGASPIANAVTNQGQAPQNIYNQRQAMTNQNINAGAGLLGSLGSAWLSR